VPAVHGVTQMGLNHPLEAILVQVRGGRTSAAVGGGDEGGKGASDSPAVSVRWGGGGGATG
jgi:hypothetical protein